MGNCIKKINIIEPESDQQPFWSFYGDCCVCMENPIQTSLYPCQHLIMCRRCTQGLANHENPNLRKCPVCRQDIEGYITFKGVENML